jgi:hypothetical protein
MTAELPAPVARLTMITRQYANIDANDPTADQPLKFNMVSS